MKVKLNSKIIASILSLLIIGILFYLGPANAIRLNIDIPKTIINQGSSINLMPTIEIQDSELADIDNITLILDSSKNNLDIECKFFPNGTIISGCDDITIDLIDSSPNQSEFGYGYGYMLGESPGYSYGYGFFNGFLRYNITINGLNIGNYTTELIVSIDSEKFDFNGETIKVLKRQPARLKDNRCSIRAFDGTFNVDNKEFSNNRLNFYISAKDAMTGSGTLTGQKGRDRFTYNFKISKVLVNNDTNLIINVSGNYRIGRDGKLRNIFESTTINFNKINNRISIMGDKIKINSMIINFITGCDSIQMSRR